MVIRAKRRRKRVARHSRYVSKLTSKYQATVPREIRRHLHLESGDQIVYELLSDETVIVRKTTPLDIDYLKSLNMTLNEWESEEDDKAYKNL